MDLENMDTTQLNVQLLVEDTNTSLYKTMVGVHVKTIGPMPLNTERPVAEFKEVLGVITSRNKNIPLLQTM